MEQKMSKEIVTVTDDEAAIFQQLDDDLFWDEITKPDLEYYIEVGVYAKSEFDHVVQRAIERALNITIPSGMPVSNGTMR